ncbi:sigma-70 family RNA polymerase sigma factor [uncultured Bacteroides sp.]|uniref:sigma-70 family RNA polymerase sigma factor n=1 Tax=uncultured Bacteroides sp. TaxID=162156 RepID=UPI0025F28C4F|nr:sigma-70 family RNA polymerase sigma factor [uncultured Bacteroides sp.]
METLNSSSEQILVEAYDAYRELAIYFIYRKTFDQALAEDIVQDAFLRLMECGQMLRKDTIKAMFFTVLRNLLYDYLRRHYKRQEINAYLYEYTETSTDEVENAIITNDLSEHERMRVEQLPTQQRCVYMMSRYEEKSACEIAEVMCLSRRTVENHLLVGRKTIREYIRECI